jgi:hypothetical protein
MTKLGHINYLAEWTDRARAFAPSMVPGIAQIRADFMKGDLTVARISVGHKV